MSTVEEQGTVTGAGEASGEPQEPIEGATPEPTGRQLRFDGMPVVDDELNFSGNVTISREAARAFKLGKQVRLEVVVLVAKRTHKAASNNGEATGDVKHLISAHVVGLVDEDE